MTQPIGLAAGMDDLGNSQRPEQRDDQNADTTDLADLENPGPPEIFEHHHQNAPICSTPSYGDVAYFAGGRNAERFVNIALTVTQFGYCVGYLIFISQTMHDIVSSAAPVQFFILAPLPILAVISTFRSIRSLGPFSVVANGALLCGFAAVVAYMAHHFHWTPVSVPLSSFPLFFGQMTASLEGIGLIIPVQSSMKNPRLFPLVLRIALVVLVTILMVVGIIGFAIFGADTHSIILLNFGQTPVVAMVKAVLIIGILFTYPLQIIPVFEFVERMMLPRLNEQHAQLDEEQAGFDVLAAEVSDREAHPESGQQRHNELQRSHFRISGSGSDSDNHEIGFERTNCEDSTIEVDAIGPNDINSNSGRDKFGQDCRREDRESTMTCNNLGGHPETNGCTETTLFVRDARRIAIRLGIVFLTAGVAVMAGASFGLFQALVGSFGASALAYTAPALLHYLTFQDQLSRIAKAKDLGIVMFGVVGAMIGTLTSVWEIVQIHRGNASPT